MWILRRILRSSSLFAVFPSCSTHWLSLAPYIQQWGEAGKQFSISRDDYVTPVEGAQAERGWLGRNEVEMCQISGIVGFGQWGNLAGWLLRLTGDAKYERWHGLWETISTSLYRLTLTLKTLLGENSKSQKITSIWGGSHFHIRIMPLPHFEDPHTTTYVAWW